MSRFSERVEQDLGHIADRATPSSTAWEAIQTRIAEQADQPEMEIIMLDKAPPPPTRHIGTWILGTAAVLVLIVGGIIALTRSDDDSSSVFAGDPESPDVIADDATTAEVAPAPVTDDDVVEPAVDAGADEATAEELAAEELAIAEELAARQELAAAEDIALQFMEARAAWDGEAVRALVADDAAIAAAFEWVDSPDDYVVLDDFEAASGMRFLDPICEQGSPGRLRCTYTMESDLTRAIGVGPYANSFVFEISDGQIQAVNHNRSVTQDNASSFVTQVYFLALKPWLDANHAGDVSLMFNSVSVGNVQAPLITEDSVALWELRVPEFVASLTE